MGLYLGTNAVSTAIGTNGGGFMMNGRLIATKTYTIKLSETNFSSITASTTAVAVTLPATTYTTTASTTITCFRLGEAYDGTPIDTYRHDYSVIFEATTVYNYSSTVAGTIHGIKNAYVRETQDGCYRSSIVSATGAIDTTTLSYISSNMVGVQRLLYQKANNTYAVSTTNYGFYCAPTPATFNTNYINLNVGSASIRGNATYFPVEAINALNPANTTMTCTWYVYEGDKNVVGNSYNRALELAAN